MNAVGSEETVVAALAEAVGVNGIAEVKIGVAIVLAEGSGGHAELKGRREILEYLAPVGIFLGAAAMALVHDDEIEEVRSELFVKARAVFVFGDGLVSGEIEFAA